MSGEHIRFELQLADYSFMSVYVHRKDAERAGEFFRYKVEQERTVVGGPHRLRGFLQDVAVGTVVGYVIGSVIVATVILIRTWL